MKSRSFLLWFCVLITVHVYGQNSATSNLSKADYPQPIPPSPEATALGRYGDIPVSLFTGQPNISVPVYSFKDGDISVAVGLNYDASGVRVDQVATNVGLGWSLAAGGMITRIVRGKPDEYYYGELSPTFNPNLPGNTNTGSVTNNDYYIGLDAVINNRDYEKDTYFFNFLNYSGKFMISNTGAVCFLPANPNLKVVPNNGDYRYGFIITDDKGFQYFFQSNETTYPTSNCNADLMAFSSAWYLTKILSPNNYQVMFEYEYRTYTLPASIQEVKYIRPGTFVNGCDDLSYLNRVCTRTEQYSGIRIKRIYSDDNHLEVNFNYSIANRLDLDYNNQHQGNYLDNITIKNNGGSGTSNNNLLKTWNFTYNYFGTGAGSRLKLLTVKEDSKPSYQFIYNETNPLPGRFDKAQDHWGYYNGKSQSTLIPAIPELNYNQGADRSADFNYAVSGSLISMKYPTGGHTDFEYEPHTNIGTSTSYVYDSRQLNVTANSGSLVTEDTFTLPAGSIDVFFSTFLFTINYDDFISGYLLDGSNTATIASGTGEIVNDVSGALANGTSPRSLKLKINRDNMADQGYVTLSWKYPVTTTATQTVYGGLRIKSVKHYDIDSHLSNSKYYNYNWLSSPSKSSGSIPTDSIKQYWSVFNKLNSVSVGPTVDQCAYAVLYSNSVAGIDNGYDQSIGYSQVTETDISDGSNGRNIYNFMPTPADNIFTLPPVNYGWSRGLLEEKIEQRFDVLSNSYKNVHKVHNYYHGIGNDYCLPGGSGCAINQVALPNWKISFSRPEQVISVDQGGYVAQFNVEKYIVISSMLQLWRMEETTYSADGARAMVKTTNFSYDNPSYTFPTAIETADSRGNIIRTENTYVPDIIAAGNGTSVHAAMLARNIIAPVLKQKLINKTTNNLLSVKTFNFGSWSNTIQPSSVVASLNNSSAVTQVTFDQYDSFGNLLMATTKGEAPVAYIWGYNGQYPIAECKNAANNEIYYQGFEDNAPVTLTYPAHTGKMYTTNAAVSWALPNGKNYVISYWYLTGGVWKYSGEQAFTGSFIMQSNAAGYDDIRIYPADAFMTTYTYEPQVGMTSASDPKSETSFYFYDNYKRLTDIKDRFGRIIRHTDYHYQNQ